MKLSDLVRARRSFSKVSVDELVNNIKLLARSINVASVNLNLNYSENIEKLSVDLSNINNIIETTKKGIDEIISDLDKKIFDLSRPYCLLGNTVNGTKNVESLNAERDRDTRSIIFDDETNFDIVSKIREFTNPIYPSLEIGPGDGYWTKHMVAADPLYLVDINKEFLDSACSQFNETYQKRIRTYHINNDGIGPNDLSILPANQFGFVLAINVFDFFTLDFATEYIKQVFSILRPGGTFIFTYNDCSYYKSAKLVESGFKGWATESEMTSICRSVGFEISESISKEDSVQWLEIKKPGILSTVKTHQALGEICSYNA